MALGASKDEVDQVIEKIMEVAMKKIWADYLLKLPTEITSTLSKLPEDKVKQYIFERQNEFPALTESALETVINDTMNDFFRFMGKRSS